MLTFDKFGHNRLLSSRARVCNDIISLCSAILRYAEHLDALVSQEALVHVIVALGCATSDSWIMRE